MKLLKILIYKEIQKFQNLMIFLKKNLRIKFSPLRFINLWTTFFKLKNLENVGFLRKSQNLVRKTYFNINKITKPFVQTKIANFFWSLTFLKHKPSTFLTGHPVVERKAFQSLKNQIGNNILRRSRLYGLWIAQTDTEKAWANVTIIWLNKAFDF